MDIYRKIAVARCDEDLLQIEGELSDLYGSPPDEVKLLLDIAELRIKASKRDIKSVVASGKDLIFSFAAGHGSKAGALLSAVSGKLRIADRKTAYLRLTESYFEPRTLISVLRKILEEETQ
jgi:transcription-repair coupling factor (superfamily II helicase)